MDEVEKRRMPEMEPLLPFVSHADDKDLWQLSAAVSPGFAVLPAVWAKTSMADLYTDFTTQRHSTSVLYPGSDGMRQEAKTMEVTHFLRKKR